MVTSSQQRRYRFSIRSMMIVVAVVALLLMPILWTVQQQRLLALEERRAVEAEMRARLEADRARATAAAMLAQVAFGEPAAEADSTTAPPASGPAAGKSTGAWAALSVNHAVFPADGVKDLVVEFTIVNDGPRPIDPGIAGSRILVNGKEVQDSARILASGPRDARFTSLPPGDHIRFTSRLGDQFQAPGTYHVSWRGDAFQAPEVSFRVLPAGAH